MIETIRHCPDCGQDRIFEQPHSLGGGCLDSADGYCPEWLCVDCSTGLLIGFIPYPREPAAEQLHRRVA